MTASDEPAEIVRLVPLWTALADLFLDTDAMLSVPYIARTIVEGGFTVAEAEHALRWDVRPAFYRNLLSIAGEWAGWPEDYVRERVLAMRGARLERLILGSEFFFPRVEWAAVVAQVDRLRGDS